MKKAIAILLALCLCVGMCACGDKNKEDTPETVPITEPQPEPQPEPSRINILGAYYGDCGATDGKKDLFIVFDYVNDTKNRQMPDSVTAVSVALIDANSYEATENVMHTYYHNNEYSVSDYGWFERQTGYRYVVGYGELLGGVKARMFVHFQFNPNDMSEAENITLTVEDQQAEFPVSDMTEITVIDEILKAGGNFEQDYIIASGKWRLDTIFRHSTSIAGLRALPGKDLAHFKTAQENLLSEDVVGNISVLKEPTYGMTKINGDYWLGEPVKTLPTFDMELFLAAYPEQAEQIQQIVADYTELNTLLGKSGSSLDRIEQLINSIRYTYADVCDAWGIECCPE